MRRCPECGARNDDSAAACSLCAKRLAPLPGSGSFFPAKGPPGGLGSATGRFSKERPSGARAAVTTEMPAADGPFLDDGKGGSILEPRVWAAGKVKPSGPPRTVKLSTTRHYLMPPFGEALPLQGSAAIVIGRDEDCQITVASPTVSRKHAQVELRGSPSKAFLKDLGTKNGSRINGKVFKGEERPLQDGDVVRLGDVTAIYRTLAPGEEEDLLRASVGGTAIMSETQLSGGDTSSGLKGDVAFYPMPELLHRLATMKVDGALNVEVDGVRGKVTFVRGAVSEARFAGLEGQAAVRALAELRRGKFRFAPPKPES